MKKDIRKEIRKAKDYNSDIFGKPLSDRRRKQIEQAVSKVVKEYGETLRLLGNA